MLKNLPRGTKISITNSIKTAFELYMRNLEWDLEAYSWDGFLAEWKSYNELNASWQSTVEESILNSEQFHQELAIKMNEDITKMLNDDPTEDQIQQIEQLVKQLNVEDPSYSCKLEAKYHIERLQLMQTV
ncbi:hypothetical protein [Bacillus sp. EAC]|uniref:hypothetical protein n=1 Tax=Bacillus sp. EAC TaxID=1978338 RepID=UPI000B451B5D|nr:hypothetical protein [Bacillus sp. EAC]